MQELRLVAVSEDGTYLVLATAGRGTRFTLPVDDRLRAAVRGHFSRLGQFEIEVESPLRPKEIQARIRSGETAEEIAESAGIPVERVRWFEGPVLQEREYMAQQAQRVTVRRPGESTPGPPLGETVEERLGRGGVDLEEVEWDSWKCEDGTWRVRLSFFEGGRPHAAEWTFDPRRRHVSPLDEIAARLTSVEWDDDDALSDTVTPLVPRRPAMKVVGGDRDAPRGLPAEPEQPGPAGPLRAAEPREYIIERGRMLDPRPAFREAAEAPLREASAPLARPAEARGRTAPAPVPPQDEPEAEADEPRGTEAAEAPAAPVRDEAASGQPGQADTHDEPEPAEQAAEAQPADDAEASQPQEDEPADAQSADETTEPVATEAPEAEPVATAEPAAEEAPEAVGETGEAEAADEVAEAGEPEAAEEPEKAPEPEPEPQVAAAPAAEAPDERRPAEAPVKEAPEPEAAAPAPAEPAQPKKPPAPRQPPRAPAKKKPATRPTMPAAQDKPATGSPAAASDGAAAQRPARRRKAKGKRASVPSWDEIMFGARRPE
ncbi:septation protein SepH [Actinomadura geliboluensis]|nr:septation protein SepH [Actinomadura geliboluensis]